MYRISLVIPFPTIIYCWIILVPGELCRIDSFSLEEKQALEDIVSQAYVYLSEIVGMLTNDKCQMKRGEMFYLFVFEI